MAYEKTEVPVVRSQDALRKLIQSHKGFGLAVISEQDPTGQDNSLEGFQAKVMIDAQPVVIKIMAKVKMPGKYWSDRQKEDFKQQEERRIWRVIYYHLKSVFEASDSGVMEFRELMLPYIVTPNGETVASQILPRLAMVLAGTGQKLLGSGD